MLLTPALARAAEASKLSSKAYRFEDLPADKDAQATYRAILEGRTHTGDYLEVHETVLDPDGRPHPPHRHVGEELFLVVSGTLEATVEGKSTKLGPGSAFFVASNDEHGIHNIGSTAAQYFVIHMGQKS